MLIQLSIACKPSREGVVEVTSEANTVRCYIYELQNNMCDVLGSMARYWIRGEKGQAYISSIEANRKKKMSNTRLTISDVEDFFELNQSYYRAIWYPIEFVWDPSFWGHSIGAGGNRVLYNNLRIRTLAMIVRFIRVLTTGKVSLRVLSNTVKLKVMEATTCRNIYEWPTLVGRPGRPQTTSQWEKLATQYPFHADCIEWQDFIIKVEEATMGSQNSLDNPKDYEQGSPVIDLEALEVEKDSEPGVEQKQRDKEEVVGSDNANQAMAGLDLIGVEDLSALSALDDGPEIINRYPETGEDIMMEEETDVPELPLELGNEFNDEEAMRDEELEIRPGLVTLEQFSDIGRLAYEDWEMDNQIQELLRPRLSVEDMAK